MFPLRLCYKTPNIILLNLVSSSCMNAIHPTYDRDSSIDFCFILFLNYIFCLQSFDLLGERIFISKFIFDHRNQYSFHRLPRQNFQVSYKIHPRIPSHMFCAYTQRLALDNSISSNIIWIDSSIIYNYLLYTL